jgi:phosphatidylethanolamine/phosphatidyl-N-methylethanolamine N-methyltransferase
MDKADILSSYKFFSKFYVFYFNPGRATAIQKMDLHQNEKILEVGVGTGMSLSLYPQDVQIVGVDLSKDMLSQAIHQMERLQLKNVQLMLMDAQNLEFADDSFDKSVAMFVASVTPNPVLMINEMKRVTKANGMIYVLNHFSQRKSLMNFFEKKLSLFSSIIGFEPLFYLDEFLEQINVKDFEDIPIRPLGYWRLLCFKNSK